MSFLILSITIEQTTIFSHLNSYIGPVGDYLKESVSKGIDTTIDKSAKAGKKLFENSAPKGDKKKFVKRRKIIRDEDIKSSDQESLDSLIEKEN